MGVFIIIHKGKPLKELWFSDAWEARNHIKFSYPKRTFFEPEENTLVCRQQGSKFKIIELFNL